MEFSSFYLVSIWTANAAKWRGFLIRAEVALNTGKLVFAQLTAHLPLTTFRRCVARYEGDRVFPVRVRESAPVER